MRQVLALCGTVAMLILGFSAPAEATTVTFSALASVRGTCVVATYLEGGLTFASSDPQPFGLCSWGSSDGYSADPADATLFPGYFGSTLVVTQTGGGSFYLQSFDLADLYNTGASGAVFFSYADASGTHNGSLNLDGLVGLQTFTLDLAGVTSFSLTQNRPYFQIDNIVVNPVPEPSTWLLLGTGLAAVAARRKFMKRV